ncbi:MAG: twin-arginine translocase TatA/TatE family subunit [Gemmatimonadota bacterium]|nr:twin-arginine translocase TatA/TatE family subunit [Gemmatimonadota bacterium]
MKQEHSRHPVSYALVIGGLGVGELLFIVLALLFFFGAKRIPEIAKGIGGGIKTFKAELKEQDEEDPDTRLLPEDRDTPGG